MNDAAPPVIPVNDQILEVRFTPNPCVMDRRGMWTKSLLKSFGLNEWQASENRIEVHTGDNKLRAFVGFKNMGLSASDTNIDAFLERASQFVKTVIDLPDFSKPLYVERLGVRVKLSQPYEGTFGTLRTRYLERYGSIQMDLRQVLGQNVTVADVGYVFDFEDGAISFKIAAGPMEQEQLAQFLSGRPDLPAVALFYDIDHWVKPSTTWQARDILETCTSLSKSAWEKFFRINELILRG